MRRLTLTQAKGRKGDLWYVKHDGERVRVLCYRRWGKDVLLMTADGRSFVIDKRTTLLYEGTRQSRMRKHDEEA